MAPNDWITALNMSFDIHPAFWPLRSTSQLGSIFSIADFLPPQLWHRSNPWICIHLRLPFWYTNNKALSSSSSTVFTPLPLTAWLMLKLNACCSEASLFMTLMDPVHHVASLLLTTEKCFPIFLSLLIQVRGNHHIYCCAILECDSRYPATCGRAVEEKASSGNQHHNIFIIPGLDHLETQMRYIQPLASSCLSLRLGRRGWMSLLSFKSLANTIRLTWGA